MKGFRDRLVLLWCLDFFVGGDGKEWLLFGSVFVLWDDATFESVRSLPATLPWMW